MSSVPDKKHLIYLHLLRIIGAIVVIAIHSSAPLLYEYTQIPAIDWWNTNLINSFSRWAVPIFIMASGTLLLNREKNESTTHFLKRRVTKVGIPFIFWFVVYYLWQYKNDLLSGFQPYTLYRSIFFEPPHIHLYFVYIILLLYLFTPLLKQIIISMNQRQLGYLLVIFLLYTVTWKQRELTFVLWLPHIFYFLFPLIKEKIAILAKTKVWIFLFIASSMVIATGTGWRFHINHLRPTYFYDYTNPLVVLQAISLFIAFYKLEWRFESLFRKHEELIVSISNKTFGIYLIAPLIQDFLWDGLRFITPQLQLSALIINMHTVITVIISLAIITIMQKTLYLKKFV